MEKVTLLRADGCGVAAGGVVNPSGALAVPFPDAPGVLPLLLFFALVADGLPGVYRSTQHTSQAQRRCRDNALC